MKYQLEVGGKKFEVQVGEISGSVAQVTVNDEPYEVKIGNLAEVAGQGLSRPASPREAPAPAAPPAAAAPPPTPAPAMAGTEVLTAPIPGLVLDIKVAVGDKVSAGQVVAVMEAMKMENNLISSVSGTVQEIRVQKGAEVSTGDVIVGFITCRTHKTSFSSDFKPCLQKEL